MRSLNLTEQTIDPVIGRRIYNVCWFCAGLGVSILQMLLLAQAWLVSRQAIAPACMVSAWVLGSLVGSRRRTTTRVWGGCLLACTLLWFVGTRLVSWRIGLVPTTWLSDGALIAIALTLGIISTAWLLQQRPWPAAGERAVLARGLVGTTAGLFVVWVLPAWAGLIGLACVMPLLAFDVRFARRAPQPEETGVVEAWVGRYWRPDLRPLRLNTTSLPRNWWWSYLVERAQESKGYVLLTLLASCAAVILGGVWGAVPTTFAGGMLETHELDKLGWLLGGQIIALVVGICWFRASRGVVGFPERLLPPSWQSRGRALALLMLVVMGGSLVMLGLPFLQAPWWLAVSLASYTLAAAVWGILLPRLRPSVGTLVLAQRHHLLGQGMGLPDTLQLAHGRAQEERVTRLLVTAEGLLIAFFTPVVGWMIDLYGSFDRVLVIVGQCFLLGLILLALISVVRSFKQPQRSQFPRNAFGGRATLSWRPGYSYVRPGLAW